ncbi:hypothetical protein [Aeromonas caviae]|uniref:hypothetical protein n=1 Tax=Aeromonas caviae TaxID=648 RepID=UPI00311DB0AA
MLVSHDLSDSLNATSRRYEALKTKFVEFVTHLENGFGHPDSILKGLSVMPSLDTNQVNINFVGKNFRLVFSVAIEQESRPIGVVRCYSLEEYPENKLIDTCGFTFMPSGESNLKDADNDWLCIDHAWAARCIGMHLVHESLKKNEPTRPLAP